jgi:hypothetical protein
MTHPTSSPIHPTPWFLSALSPALLLAGGWVLLTATPAWGAPAGAPAAATAHPQVKVGDACPVPGRITAADGSLRGFAPATNFYLEVDGKEAPAELYRIDTTAVLVISPALPSPIVIKGMTVAGVPPAKIEKRADGTVDVRQDAVLQQLGSFNATYDTVSFKIGGHSQVLRSRPPLDFLKAPGAASAHPPG